MLFSDYLEFWLQWKRKSWEEVTYSGYCQNVRSWIGPYFAKRKVRLNEITVLDIEMFYTHEINKRGSQREHSSPLPRQHPQGFVGRGKAQTDSL